MTQYVQSPYQHCYPFAAIQRWTPQAIEHVDEMLDQYDTVQIDKFGGRFHVWFKSEDDRDQFVEDCEDIKDEE